MSKGNLRLFAITIALAILPLIGYSQIIKEEKGLYDEHKDFIEKAIVAVLSGALVYLANYVLARRKEKREGREISYTLQINAVAKREDGPLKSDIKIAFKGNTVEHLSFVSCKIKNTGLLVVKRQSVRFEFNPADCEILDSYVLPLVEPEIGVTKEIADASRSKFEEKYSIAHLVAGKEVNINFIIAGENAKPKIIDFNEEGDVVFNELIVNKKASDATIVRDFILINFIICLIEPLCSSNFALDTAWAISFIVFNVNYVNSIPRILSELFSYFYNKKKNDLSVTGNSNVIVHDSRLDGTRLDVFTNPNENKS